MRAIKLTGFCFALLFAASVSASPSEVVLSERALREACSTGSQAEMRDCLVSEAENSQKALRQAEENMLGTIAKWDEDSKYLKQAKAKLATANKDFAKYRDTQCAFSSSLGGGAIGGALEVRRLACVAELNNRRAEQLRNAGSDLPLK